MVKKIIRLLKKLLGRDKQSATTQHDASKFLATIVPRAQHNISRAAINKNALKVLYRLKKAGFSAYLVGGGVRDLLLGYLPKDFDIATNAHPEEVRKLFRNCILIGRRFRLAHIRFHQEIIEVATFRASQKHVSEEHKHERGMILRDNIYGTMEEDAWRRDFTVNALYYNIADFTVIDYCNGITDLQKKILRIIGEPRQRYHEDPVRLLRAIRLAAKLNFEIESSTKAPIKELGILLEHVSTARLFEETLKLFLGGKSLATFELLEHYQLLQYLFAQTSELLISERQNSHISFITQALKNTDERITLGKIVNPSFIFAALLWPALQHQIKSAKKSGMHGFMALQYAISKVISRQIQQTAIPKRLLAGIKDIWALQYQLERRSSFKAVSHLLTHRRFRASYDFLLLRSQTGENVKGLDVWWNEFQSADEATRQQLFHIAKKSNKKKHKKKVDLKKYEVPY